MILNSYFLQEQAILQEADLQKDKGDKVVFRMVIQTADEVNNNHRIYPKDVLVEAMKNADDRIRSRSFYGELDHPILTQDSIFNQNRQTVVLLKEASHIIRDYQWEGNILFGEFESLSTPNGKILYELVREKTTIGVSMRGIGQTIDTNKGRIVKKPLTIITYDIVSKPSHSKAIIDERQITFESLQESENNKKLVCVNNVCFVANHLDRLIESDIITFCKRWI